MLSPRAMFQEVEADLAEQWKCKAVRPETKWLSSAPTRCPTSELLAFSDDQGADAHKESWGATALPGGGEEPALLETALLEAVSFGDGQAQLGPAMPAPTVAPLRRLRSEAFWEQRAAASWRPPCSPWEAGVRQRRPCLDARGCLAPDAVATPAAEGAEGEGAAGSPRRWAGAVSRELRRGARGRVAPPAPPRGSPLAAPGAALRSRGRSYHPVGSRWEPRRG
ncbi:unnamed protein product [Prorocentrum cordatum]|uniref:Uncharacterized protein n=1 Tax=Prorocentrum cordatum TaxID=2364126 RepID=A0ABN9W6X5_9DINO|nr:unnamed protein product [Polarella glacialis]